MYEEAVNDQEYSFLFINLKQPEEKMFSIRFDEILQVENNDGQLPGVRDGYTEEEGGT